MPLVPVFNPSTYSPEGLLGKSMRRHMCIYTSSPGSQNLLNYLPILTSTRHHLALRTLYLIHSSTYNNTRHLLLLKLK